MQDDSTWLDEQPATRRSGTHVPRQTTDAPRPHKPYTVKQLAAALGVSGSTVYRDIESGRLEAYRIGVGKGTLRIPQDAFQRYLARITAEAVTKPADVVA
jgi:excisionase family DNA binding protein